MDDSDNSQSSEASFFAMYLFTHNRIMTETVEMIRRKVIIALYSSRKLEGLMKFGLTPLGGGRAGRSRRTSRGIPVRFITCYVCMYSIFFERLYTKEV